MELKEDDDGHEERSSSSSWVWHHISEEALRVANEYLGSASPSPERPRHKRSQSDIASLGRQRSSSFQNLKFQLSKAWRWRVNSQSNNGRFNFDPEELIRIRQGSHVLSAECRVQHVYDGAKRRVQDHTKYREPTALFEHFIVTGLHPDANLEAVEVAFARRKKWELETARSDAVDGRSLYYRGPSQPSLDPQRNLGWVLARNQELALMPSDRDRMIFKYPPGKKPPMRLKDLCAFTFPGGVKARLLERTPSLSDLNSLVYGQAADNATLYGVCLQVPEIVQRTPSILGYASPLSHPSAGCSRLHYDMLNSIIAQERLNRITQFVSEMSLNDYSLSASREHDDYLESCDSPNWEEGWMSMAIPVESAIALSAAAAGIVTEDEVPSASKSVESLSPSSGDASETSDFGHAPVASDNRANAFGRADENYENGTSSPEAPLLCHSDHKLERMRSMDDDDGYFSSQESDHSSDSLTMEWAKETKNDMLQIVCAYAAMTIPERGSDLVFQPLKHLQAILYKRPSVSDLGIGENSFNMDNYPIKSAEMSARLAAAEEAVALSVWTTATICRVLSLDSGVLSAVVLSLTPMIRPFEWQSLFLPILPVKMLDFLDAPVPYIVGMQNIPADLRLKTSNLVHVDVAKDQVKTCSLPLLPRRKELYNELRPIHAAMASQVRIAAKHPVYRCNEVQAEAATCFLNVTKRYMESLCAELRFYSITNVQSNDDRVSLLLKDSFIDSFPSKDQSFIKSFTSHIRSDPSSDDVKIVSFLCGCHSPQVKPDM
ncbi:hypothetical protein Cgig2_031785 [Carnegiea gigantea]|uniref:cDENN domain-containing protein n=1 Tax=Carnegiea gigantea TaxID=171969 RepID=A0A9Q1GMT7_9CARY|nr:hypothetical protein Cgig2_031785 [Carnegiea gigantea]